MSFSKLNQKSQVAISKRVSWFWPGIRLLLLVRPTAYKFHLCSCWFGCFHYSVSFPSNVPAKQPESMMPPPPCLTRSLKASHVWVPYKNVDRYYYCSQVLAQTLMWWKQNSVGWRLFVFLNSEFSHYQTQFLINCHFQCLRKHGGFLLLNDIFSFYKLKEPFLCPPSAAGVVVRLPLTVNY